MPQLVGIYLLKVNNKNTTKRCEICSKLTIKTPERRQWRFSGVFIVKSEHFSHLVLVFLLLTFNMSLPAENLLGLLTLFPASWNFHKPLKVLLLGIRLLQFGAFQLYFRKNLFPFLSSALLPKLLLTQFTISLLSLYSFRLVTGTFKMFRWTRLKYQLLLYL